MRRVSVLAGLSSTLALLAMLAAPPPAHALVWPDVPDRVERGLASPDPTSRRAAARELASLSAARATPLVQKAMADGDVEVRLAAAQAAVRLRLATTVDLALQWLGERDPKLRVAACDVAGAMPAPRSVQPLARALGDADPVVRGACADALGAQASAEAVAPLSGKLDDPTPAVRSQVARALARLGDPRAVVPLVGKVQDSVPEVRQSVVRALGDLGDPRATQALLLALRDTVAEVKIEALAALGRLRAPEAASAIAPLALERNPAVRQAALVALGRIATADAVRALIRAIGTQEDAAGTLERTSVRDALVSAGPPAVTELTALLEQTPPPSVATSAAWVLGELRATRSAPVLVAALRKGTLPPAAALRALAGAGTADQVPVVLEFVADPNPTVREEALRAATSLLDPAHPDGRAVEPLAATLRAPRTSPGERAAVATLLGRTGAPRATAELAGLVASKDPALRLAAIDALGALGAAGANRGGDVATDDALVPLVTDTDAPVRLHAAMALAASGGPKARAALTRLLDGGGEVDRFAVLTALGGILERLPDEKTATHLFQLLTVAAGPERDAMLEAVGRARLPGVVQGLAKVAKQPDLDDRRMVAAVLGGHRGNAAAVALVRSLVDDADASVRAQAAYTLGAIGGPEVLPALGTLAKSGDEAVATDAAGGIARFASLAPSNRAAVVPVACPLLADGRPTVRANGLAALAFVAARCSDGRVERTLLASDPSDLVRSAAARALTAAPVADDRVTLDHCVSSDRSAEIARLCRPRPASAERDARAARPARAVTAYVVGEAGTAARPHAAFLLEYEGGLLRAGTADRRGATFDPAAPAGDLTLRRR